MTWKAYAAVSGATVLAGWVVSAPPPSGVPDPGIAARDIQSHAVAATPSEIEREAARLAARLRLESAYARPERDPFRFGAARPRASVPADPVGDQGDITAPAAAGPAETVPDSRPAPLVSLAGVAEDRREGPDGPSVERTAVLSAPDDVLLVREGDEVLGLYRVVRIESDAVELQRADGTTLRLGFQP
ncbi:MAG: hypothetical protein O2930_03495 [Acidobacteria bacterium]|nr:hypothetical protein [Acidobacteriota bacterium]